MQPPKIDKRNYNEIIKDISQKLPYYAPLLKFDEAQKDPTGALIKIFAGMFEGTLKNLNRVPEKNYLAFLNMLGTKIIPSEPARVPLTFRINKGAKNPVFIRKGAKVSANPQDGGSPVIFETEKGILAMPSKLQSAFYASKEKDFIAQVPQELLTEDAACAKSGKSAAIFDFLDEKNLQSHVFYIGDRELFNFCKPVTFKITFPAFAERLYKVEGSQTSNESPVKWYYYAGEAEDKSPLWKAFKSLPVNKNEDFISLEKDNTDEIKLFKINEVESRWIKCEIDAGNADFFTGVRIKPENIVGEWVLTAKESGKAIIKPDKAFYNSIPLSLGKDIYPFSQTPRTNDIFYLSCNEALNIKDGDLTLSFKLDFSPVRLRGRRNTRKITASLSWEYWNGKSWAKLNIENGNNTDSPTNNLDDPTNNTIEFLCPKDIEDTSVNGEKGLWIRAHIISGDYGRDVVVKNGEVYSLKPDYKAPCLSNITISVSKTKRKQIDDFITCNNLSFYRYNRIQDKNSEAVEIVSTPENNTPAFYLSFDKAFEKGPVSIFFSIGDRAYTKEDMPRMRWEYYSGTGAWKNIEVSDDGTQSLTRTGALVFSMPADFASSVCFGRKLYWIRAVELNGRYTSTVKSVITPALKGIYLNTVWASQSETVEDEFFSSSGTHNQQFTLSKTSVTYHEIWINEINSLTEADRLEITQSGNFKTNEVKDSFGETKEFWVKWQPVSDILLSMPADRCYEADPAFGLIRFGDGENGAVPPIGLNNIRSVYRAGGGSRGNLETGEITSMNSSISFVEGVFNPEPSKGGFEMETIAQMLKRASKGIRNRGNAVTPTDFEELAYEASRSIARVKCLPNTNDKGDCETGWVSLVVLPWSPEGKPVCSTELIRLIEGYVSSRTSSNIAFPGKFRVINPDYIEISVTADVKVTDIELLIDVEKEILTRLSDFLNPIKGGSRGEGWDFGRMPYFSDFYALLERIPGVDYVEELSLLITDPGRNNPVLVDRTRILDLEKYSLKPHALVSNGKHSITLKI